MKYKVDAELFDICSEIKGEGKSEGQWAEVESSDWFQTPRYCGGFDASDMHFAFTVSVGRGQFCFALTLNDALLIADHKIDEIEIRPSSRAENSDNPWQPVPTGCFRNVRIHNKITPSDQL